MIKHPNTMTRADIIKKIKDNHAQFITDLSGMDETDFVYAQPEKWSAGQQLEHIVKAIAPINMAFSLPRFMLRLMFGKPNRKGRTYDELVQKYQAKLAAGGKSTKPFIPKLVVFTQKTIFINHLQKSIDKLEKQLAHYDENQLDSYLLPHPLLGKLTLREMLYFSTYHVEHHRLSIKKQLFER